MCQTDSVLITNAEMCRWVLKSNAEAISMLIHYMQAPTDVQVGVKSITHAVGTKKEGIAGHSPTHLYMVSRDPDEILEWQ